MRPVPRNIFTLPLGASFALDVGNGRVANIALAQNDADGLVWAVDFPIGLRENLTNLKLQHPRYGHVLKVTATFSNKLKKKMAENPKNRDFIAKNSARLKISYQNFLRLRSFAPLQHALDSAAATAGASVLLSVEKVLKKMGLVVVSNDGGCTTFHTETWLSDRLLALFEVKHHHGAKRPFHTVDLQQIYSNAVREQAKTRHLTGELTAVTDALHVAFGHFLDGTKPVSVAAQPRRPSAPSPQLNMNTWI